MVTNGWNSCSATSVGDARAGVGDGDLDHVVGERACVETTSSRRSAVVHRLDGVADQVEQHLLDLDPVGEHQIGARIELEADPDAVLLGADQGQRARLLDQLGEALDPPLALAAADEIAQAADDLAGAQRLLGRLVERVAHHRRALVGRLSRAGAASPSGSWRSPTAAG